MKLHRSAFSQSQAHCQKYKEQIQEKSSIMQGSAVVSAVVSIDEAMQDIIILIKIKVRLFFVICAESLIVGCIMTVSFLLVFLIKICIIKITKIR